MKGIRIKTFVATVVFALSVNAHAGTVVCGGTVLLLAYHQPGRLMLRLSSMNVPVFICSTDSEWVVPGTMSGNTSVSACKSLHATLLAAKMAEKNIPSMYFDGDQVPGSCSSFASWTNVNVRYMEH